MQDRVNKSLLGPVGARIMDDLYNIINSKKVSALLYKLFFFNDL